MGLKRKEARRFLIEARKRKKESARLIEACKRLEQSRGFEMPEYCVPIEAILPVDWSKYLPQELRGCLWI